MPLQGVTIFCFAASYAVALAWEVVHLVRPSPWIRYLTHGFAAAGLLAHTIYIAFHGLPPSGGTSSLLFLSWIVAVFYLYGSIHYRRLAWGVFALPVVLLLVLIGSWPDNQTTSSEPSILEGAEHLWAWLHAGLLILGAVGVCVGFVASLMYLVQSRKLKHKLPSDQGLHLLSLERLEEMNRRAINWSFPLFTVGLLIGLFLWRNERFSWLDPKVLSTGVLWLAFIVLLYLRYGLHLRGRRIALGTIAAFLILLLAFTVHFILPSSHHFGGGL